MENNKKRYGLFIFLFLVILIFIGIGFVYYSDDAGNIESIRTSNLSSNSITISWTTPEPEYSALYLSKDNNWIPLLESNGKTKYYDDRDMEENSEGNFVLKSSGETKRKTHHIILRDLEPETTYYYKITSGTKLIANEDNSFRTQKVSETIDTPDPAYGKVVMNNSSKTFPSEGILYYRLMDTSSEEPSFSATYSTTLNSQNSWSIDLSLINDINGDDFKYNKEFTLLSFDLLTDVAKTNGSLSLDRYQPLPDIVLGLSEEEGKISLGKTLLTKTLASNGRCDGIAKVGSEVCVDRGGKKVKANELLDGDGDLCDYRYSTNSCGGDGGSNNNNNNPSTQNPTNSNCKCDDLTSGQTACDASGKLWRCTCNWWQEVQCSGSCGGARGSASCSTGSTGTNPGTGSAPTGGFNEYGEGKTCTTDADCKAGTCGCVSGSTKYCGGYKTKCNDVIAIVTKPGYTAPSASTNAPSQENTIPTNSSAVNIPSQPTDTCCGVDRQCSTDHEWKAGWQACQANQCGCAGGRNKFSTSSPQIINVPANMVGTTGLTPNCTISQGFASTAFSQYYNGNPNIGTDYACAAGTPLTVGVSGWVVTKIRDTGETSSCGPASGTGISCSTYYSGQNGHPNYGNYVEICNPQDGACVRYSHLQDVNVLIGQTINPGTQLGVVGKSGNATNPHVDIELRVCAQTNAQGNCFADITEYGSSVGGEKNLDNNLITTASAQTTQTLSDGVYEIQGENTPDFIYIANNENVDIRFFNDLNKDGKKQANESYVTTNNVRITKKIESESFIVSSGWNLLSFNLVSNDWAKATDLIKLISEQGINVTSISSYTQGKWMIYSKRSNQEGKEELYGTDFPIVPGIGYFIKTTNGGQFNLNGQKFLESVPMTLQNGWNLVGVQAPGKTYTASSLLQKCTASDIGCSSLARFDSGLYDIVVLDGGVVFGNDYNLIAKSGYFLKVNNKGGKPLLP